VDHEGISQPSECEGKSMVKTTRNAEASREILPGVVQEKQKVMNSRSKILDKLKAAQRDGSSLPEVTAFSNPAVNVQEKFAVTLTNIGGTVVKLETHAGINEYILQKFPIGSRILSMLNEVNGERFLDKSEAHSFETVDFFILEAHFAVAENGACWVTSQKMGDRVLPFVCQHLGIVLRQKNVVETLHQAYERIGDDQYEFGTFIAGPSKTADIEQSLVLGAHGPKTLTVFFIP
jgi:L-lactate dehydrogenase complex protein LldG